MKKRRELDALVTNGKLPRRKSKSGHELLRSNDSDSSEVEEFSVQIGTKAGKKWIGICPCSSCVALLVFIVMTSCLIACGGLIWMHFELKRDLDSLRERLLTVENRNQGTPEEFQRYHSQIQELNKTVHNLRAGEKGIDKMGNNITQIATQLEKLKKVTDGLREDLQKAPLLKDLPNRFESLTSTVAKMGSDVQNANTQLESLDDFKKKTLVDLQDLKIRVANVENRTRSGESSVGRERGSPHTVGATDSGQMTQQIQLLSHDIDALNNSLAVKVLALNTSLITHETRLSLLEKFTAQTATPEINKQELAEALRQLMNGDSSEGSDLSVLSSVLDKVDNITTMVGSLGQLYEKLQAEFNDVRSYTSQSTSSGVGSGEMAVFQAQTLSNLEYLNATVITMNDHMDHLYKVFTQNRNELNNITAHLGGLMKYLSIQTNATSSPGSETTKISTGQPPTTIAHAKKPSPSVASATEKPAVPTITMKLVHSLQDLEDGFNRWDRNGEGQVDPDDLPDFMRDPPSKEQLKPFDADNNGKYSLAELKTALGFDSDTATEEVKHIFE